MMEKRVTKPKVFATGLAFGESPRWHDNRLWVANWGTGEIVTINDEGNTEIVFSINATLPYSFDWLPDGRMLVVSGRDGLLLRQDRDGSLVTHANLKHLSQSPWNEIVVDGRGNIYVNGGGPQPSPGENFGPGTIVLIRPDGSITEVADDIAFANGMAVAADKRTLILAESHGQRLTAFDIADDGTLANRRVWAYLDGFPDGICIDSEGAVWYADVPNQRCVRVCEGGKVLDTITVDRACFACMLGGDERKTLYIMAAEWRGFDQMVSPARTGQVLTYHAPAAGVGWP
ncbi:SMP-30/gluconolactonase/LRE family protein [Mesorhizobium sp. NBSH29]|uniref:SMP-30/gluconolactonase/LRE family protein n=1 Tax=Mesorhizobium sp. NBSH29 TaxID=2654249 RepID=UPI0018966BA8|nr:SMP-30/gluconolactonase/LRE family protein [Mesorhizobium sp. NBSH29]QPC87294.1 SMP-30/gluconolactonase/LRE family protein [Mesorhizobium sp. NBSH29]